MRNNVDVNKKLGGYYPTYRGKLLLLQTKKLTHQEYILYDASIILADWDKKHGDRYGVINLTQSAIEYVIGCSKGFVSRYGKGLYKKGFWVKDSYGRTRVVGFELIETGLLKTITKRDKVVNLQNYIVNKQSYDALLQQDIAVKQLKSSKEESTFQGKSVADLQPPRPISDLVSSKGKYSFRDTSTGLSDEDIRLIEESLAESTQVKDKEGGYD
jgi:hypothetical protein